MGILKFNLVVNKISFLIRILLAASAVVLILFFLESCKQKTTEQFEVLKANDTGIKFNPLSKTTTKNPNSIKDFGCAVSVVDINQDSLPDLVFSSIYGKPEIYLNQGDFKFENITVNSGINFPDCFVSYGVGVADINNDGRQDLYFCNNGGCGNNLFYINNGNLTFSEKSAEYGLAIHSNSYMPYFFDYDKDNDLDLFLVNWPNIDFNPLDISYMALAKRDTGTIHSLLLENVQGKFKDVTAAKGLEKFPATNNAAIISDINQDGWPDIYVDNDYVFPDQYYINHGGYFSNELKNDVSKTTMFSMGVDCADLNNDLYPDLVEADMLSPTHYRRKLNTLALSTGFYDELKKYSFPQYQRNMLQMNNSGKNFSETGYLSGTFATEWSWSPLAADFDNDGMKDLFYTCGSRRELTNMDYVSNYINTSGTYDPVKQWLLDWKNIPAYKYHNFIFKNINGFQFTDMSKQWGMNNTVNSEGASYADLDGDGDLDIVICNTDESPSILKNNQNIFSDANKFIRFRLHGIANGGYTPGTKFFLYAAGKQQYVEAIHTKGFISVSEDMIHFGIGKASFADSAVVVWPSGKIEKLVHLTGNKVFDVFEKNADGNTSCILKMDTATVSSVSLCKPVFIHTEDVFNDFKRDKTMSHMLSRMGPALGKCDLDNDGNEDVFVGGAHGAPSAVYIQNSDGNFTMLQTKVFDGAATNEDICVAFADIDKNGFADIIVGSGSNADNEKGITQNIRIYMNDGGLKFHTLQNALPAIPEAIATISVEDIDGDIDLFAGARIKAGEYGKIPNSYLLEKRKGIFVDVTDVKAPALRQAGMVSTSVFVDIDKDGKNELVLSGEFMPVNIFKNVNGKWNNITSSCKLENTNGWWNCIEPVDIDNDGDLDLLAGNWGLNSIFTASRNEPLSLWVNDFDKNGSLDPLLFHYLHGVNAPFNGRDLFCKQMPVFFNKFNTYESYARCTAADVFDSTALKGTQKYFAYTLQSAVFINNGKGQFVTHPLPPQVQQAPVNSFVVYDFNKDGFPDFIPFGNTNSNFFDQGDIDALRSRIFLGDGKGNFISNSLTAAFNRNDVVNHTCLVFDKALGKQLLFAGVNNGALKTYPIAPPLR
jgi:hypothetical protein